MAAGELGRMRNEIEMNEEGGGTWKDLNLKILFTTKSALTVNGRELVSKSERTKKTCFLNLYRLALF